MDHQRLITALRKAGITDITEPHKDHSGRYVARNAQGKVLVWWVQDGTERTKMRPQAQCVHWPSPLTDTQTDCFCDRYFHSIKSAVYSLNPEHYRNKKAAQS